jgi:transposase-like protein
MCAAKNCYSAHAKISAKKFREIVNFFAIDLDATQITKAARLNRNTVNRYLTALRRRIAENCERSGFVPGGAYNLKSSSNDTKVQGATWVLAIFKINGCIRTEVIENCRRRTLRSVVDGSSDLSSLLPTNGWRGGCALVDLGNSRYFRLSTGRTDPNAFSEIDSFFGYVTRRTAKFRGLHRATRYLHLKECEFRYNNRKGDLYKKLLELLRQKPLF